MIRYSEAKKILAKYQGLAGTCPANEDTDLFVRKVLQYLLLKGTEGNERVFVFQAENGCITLPKELETPLKIRIDGAIGSVWDRWFEYKSGNNLDNCCLAQDSLKTQPNLFPTVYDLPPGGGYPAVKGVCDESDDAHVVFKGTDLTGREIITTHNGEQIVGEYVKIRKNCLTRTTVKFGKLTGVAKTKTNGYVNVVSVDDSGLCRKFLSDYTPFEENPAYQRATILSVPCPILCGVSILGRIRLKDHYADDDLIPFDNYFLLDVAGQTINSMFNDQIERAVVRDKFVGGLIETEGNYKKVNNGQPLEMFKPLSGGSVVNAGRAGRRLRRGFWNGRR